MSIIATALKHLIAAGVTGDALVAAVADMEASQPKDAVAERRRTWDRERKRTERLVKSGGIPVESAESAENAEPVPFPAPPMKKNLTPPPISPDNNPAREGISKLVRPDDVSEQTWADFLKHRKRIKADATPTAINRIRKQAEEAGWSMEDALAELVSRGWRGFNSEWVKSAAKPADAKPADPNAGKSLARYQAGEISFEEFDRTRRESEPRRTTSTGPPRPIGQLLPRLATG